MITQYSDNSSEFNFHKEQMRVFYELHKRGLLTLGVRDNKRLDAEHIKQIVPIWIMKIPPGSQN